MSNKTITIYLLIGILTLTVAAAAYQRWAENPIGAPMSNIKLDVFKSINEIKEYLRKNTLIRLVHTTDILLSGRPAIPEAAIPLAEMTTTKQFGESVVFSRTNVQVGGIDEIDYVKTDGTYIYFKNGTDILIAKAYPPEDLRIIGEITIENGNINGLYIYRDRLVVITWRGGNYYIMEELDNRPALTASIIPPPTPTQPHTNIYIYDITNLEDPSLIYNISIYGWLVDSRLMNGTLYIATASQAKTVNDTVVLPYYIIDGENISIPIEKIYYMKNLFEYNYQYTTIFTFDLETGEHDVTSLMSGSTSTLYMSYQNMYLAQPIYSAFEAYQNVQRRVHKTAIIKIEVNGLEVDPVKVAIVEGMISEQLQMDEFDGYLRVSTYVIEYIEDKYRLNVKIYTNLYILDQELNIVGKVERLAESEQLYATRFIGNYAYLVTFRRIDPLFVINLSDPTNPQVVGELKIPGFSDMLQPIGKDLIVGIGHTDEIGGMNLKISLFNVSDPTNPTEISKIIIGVGWATSEATYNHRAILITPLEGVFGIPVETMETVKTVVNQSGVVATIIGPSPVYKFIVINASDGRLEILKEINVTIPLYNTDSGDVNPGFRMVWIEYTRGIYIEGYIYVVTPYGISVEPLE